MSEDEDQVDYGDVLNNTDPLDEDWDQYVINESNKIEPPETETLPPEYLLRNNIAKHKQLAQILAVYFHAKHGESMQDVFEHLADTRFEETPIQSIHFYLENKE